MIEIIKNLIIGIVLMITLIIYFFGNGKNISKRGKEMNYLFDEETVP